MEIEKLEERKQRVVCVATESEMTSFVMAQIIELDRTARKLPEGNPSRMWVITRLTPDEITSLEKVEDAIVSGDQTPVLSIWPPDSDLRAYEQ